VSTPGIERWTATDVVAGFLSSFAIFFAAIGLVWHPLRVVPISIVLALVSTAMGGRNRGRLPLRRDDGCRADEPPALVATP
jgi:hypothetical protein